MIEELPVLQAPGRTACTLIILVGKKGIAAKSFNNRAPRMPLLHKSTGAQCVHFAAHLNRTSQQ